MRRAFAAFLALFIAGPAWCADLVVEVVTPDGAPVADAVATLPAGNAPRIAFPWKLEMAQKDKTFVPFVLIAPAGGEVVFPNLDKFRHHVYSFSKGNKFELELYGREEKRSVTLKTAGVAAIGCNIHDEMVGFIRVVDTPFAAKSGADGVASIANAPAGAMTVTVWHPYAKGRDKSVETDVVIPASGEARVRIVLPLTAHSGH